MSRPLAGTRVLALGAGLTLVGVLRILAADGATAWALPDVDVLPRRSRWYRAASPRLSGVTPATLAACLDGMPEHTVLLPCSDAWLRALASLPATVTQRYPVSVASPSAIEILLDKARFGSTLARLGLPHPVTRANVTQDDLAQLPDDVLRGSFLKPAHSQQFFAAFGVKAFRVTGREDAARQLTRCMEAGQEVILQEYIPGPPTNHYYIEGFVDRQGITRARFARQRLRMFPLDFGNSTLMVSVPLAEVKDGVETLDALLADLRYRGVFSAEFKRDDRAGRLKLIEVNARPWWYVEFAARCGVDVCALAVRDALGETVPTISNYALGRRCVYPYYDYSAARAERAAGRLSLLGWARSWIGATQPVFRWSDPMPALRDVAAMIGRRFS